MTMHEEYDDELSQCAAPAARGQKLDLSALFPVKGDPRRPPEWLGRALLYGIVGVCLAAYAWQSWSAVSFIALDVVISAFIALAVEPVVVSLVKHGWRRAMASLACLVGLMALIISLLVLFGNMFVQQVISMANGFPAVYEQVAAQVAAQSQFRLPEISHLGNEILKNVQSSWITDFAGQALNTTVSVFGSLINLLTIIMVTYSISAAGPQLRRSLCQWMAPSMQRHFLRAWHIVQGQISGFLFSRIILAALNATVTGIFLMLIHVPYWLPLALFSGLAAQFIPIVGAIIGGSLPVLFAWGANGMTGAVMVLVFIIVYQQIENMLIAPAISQRTMNLNPAVAFLSVLLFGALFGALGAFLALPVVASLQTMLKLSLKRYDLVDSPLMDDPAPTKISKVVEGAEVFNQYVIQPVGKRMAQLAADEEASKVAKMPQTSASSQRKGA